MGSVALSKRLPTPPHHDPTGCCARDELLEGNRGNPPDVALRDLGEGGRADMWSQMSESD